MIQIYERFSLPGKRTGNYFTTSLQEAIICGCVIRILSKELVKITADFSNPIDQKLFYLTSLQHQIALL
jgi:hypothetical protein